jgi:hypothetical protein
MHGNSIASHGRCSGRPQAAAAERPRAPFGRLVEGTGGAERRARGLSSGAQRRLLQPRATASANAGFRSREEDPIVY